MFNGGVGNTCRAVDLFDLFLDPTDSIGTNYLPVAPIFVAALLGMLPASGRSGLRRQVST
tara:strand:+ start:77 stop:256 length:180 start_codon:yes stop_codon:yes gene_type:complete